MASSQPKKDEKPTSSEAKPEEAQQKSAAALEEDDEFEDFPVEGLRQPLHHASPTYCCTLRPYLWLTPPTDWPVEETEAANSGETKHLWEESWDDDDTSDDFSQQLKYVTPLSPQPERIHDCMYTMHTHLNHPAPFRSGAFVVHASSIQSS